MLASVPLGLGSIAVMAREKLSVPPAQNRCMASTWCRSILLMMVAHRGCLNWHVGSIGIASGLVRVRVRPCHVNFGGCVVDMASLSAGTASQRPLPLDDLGCTSCVYGPRFEDGHRATCQRRMRYPPALRKEILLLHEEGLSSYQIGRRVGKRAFCVSRFLHTTHGRPSTSEPTQRGPARLLSLRDERVVKRLVLSGTFDTASELSRNAASLGRPAVSAKTIRRALR